MKMHDTPDTTPLALEERMRLAFERMQKVVDPTDKDAVQLSFEVAAPQNTAFYARIGNLSSAYGFGATAEEAADKAISTYGTPESRRAAQIQKLQAEAAKLGCVLETNPAPKPGSAVA